MRDPLFLQPVMQEKIWGGTKLATAFSYDLPSQQVGECWAISAHPNGVSVIENGSFAGWSLDRLYAERRDLFGGSESPVFPLLTKILDANDWLSVQVHPDDAYALAHEGELGKTECWYVLAAEEGSEIIYGHTATSRDELAQLMAEKDWDRLLRRVPVQAGDFFYVPSGTIHAIGKGILILETQQSSDTTYRLYDFDRRDDEGRLRDLHLDHSLAVTRIDPPEVSHPSRLFVGDLLATTFVSNAFFTVSKWELDGTSQLQATAPYYLISVLEGRGELVIDDRCFPLAKGQHLILPTPVDSWTLTGQLELIVSHP